MTVERVPWGDGNEDLTVSFRRFLARGVKRLLRQETADAFSTTWDNVFRTAQHAVERVSRIGIARASASSAATCGNNAAT